MHVKIMGGKTSKQSTDPTLEYPPENPPEMTPPEKVAPEALAPQTSETSASMPAKKKKKVTIATITHDFLGRTNMHGISQIPHYNNVCAKLFWLILFICGLLALAGHVSLLVCRYLEYPTQTKLQFKAADALAFPAVTICNANPVKRTIMQCSKKEWNKQLLALDSVITPKLRKKLQGVPHWDGQPIKKGERIQFAKFDPNRCLELDLWTREDYDNYTQTHQHGGYGGYGGQGGQSGQGGQGGQGYDYYGGGYQQNQEGGGSGTQSQYGHRHYRLKRQTGPEHTTDSPFDPLMSTTQSGHDPFGTPGFSTPNWNDMLSTTDWPGAYTTDWSGSDYFSGMSDYYDPTNGYSGYYDYSNTYGYGSTYDSYYSGYDYAGDDEDVSMMTDQSWIDSQNITELIDNSTLVNSGLRKF